MNRLGACLSCVLLMVLAHAAGAAETVREFRGDTSRILPDFEVSAPWILEWRVSTDHQGEAAVDISLEQAGTNVHQGNVLRTRWPGNGVRLFEEGGRFHFRVDSSLASWTLKVIQLTPEEAKAYTPRQRGPADQ